ncbi:MAG: Sir2 family NAD-dependent protein deacetylase [Bacteroidia bacterium]
MHLVVLTGAGISAESGLKTFRGAGGLWEGHAVTDVATPEAFQRDPALVLRFYNERRKQAFAVHPNEGHKALVELEKHLKVSIITQNVDDLHERAGSQHVTHLHGELRKKRSTANPDYIEDWNDDLSVGDLAPDGGHWRPHIVWFGEEVPMMTYAAHIAEQADALLIVGTSLQVYPAAGLVDFVPEHAPIYLVDPNIPEGFRHHPRITAIEEPGSTGVAKAAEYILGGF